MLKIKNDVTFQKLKKYGFKRKKVKSLDSLNGIDYYIYIKELVKADQKEDIPHIYLEIVDNKYSEMYRCISLCCGEINREVTEISLDCFDEELDVIYDLIIAGLIEKI